MSTGSTYTTIKDKHGGSSCSCKDAEVGEASAAEDDRPRVNGTLEPLARGLNASDWEGLVAGRSAVHVRARTAGAHDVYSGARTGGAQHPIEVRALETCLASIMEATAFSVHPNRRH